MSWSDFILHLVFYMCFTDHLKKCYHKTYLGHLFLIRFPCKLIYVSLINCKKQPSYLGQFYCITFQTILISVNIQTVTHMVSQPSHIIFRKICYLWQCRTVLGKFRRFYPFWCFKVRNLIQCLMHTIISTKICFWFVVWNSKDVNIIWINKVIMVFYQCFYSMDFICVNQNWYLSPSLSLFMENIKIKKYNTSFLKICFATAAMIYYKYEMVKFRPVICNTE